MELKILKYEEAKPYLNEVILNADKNRSSLGFLFNSAYAESIEKGFLWVLTLNEGYIGHLLFGGKYPNLKIFQIFIGSTYHKKGYGKYLVMNFIEYARAEHVQTISIKVATELQANNFWLNCGFILFNQEGGRGNKRLVNKYLYEVDRNQLFENSGSEGIIPFSDVKNGKKSPISTVPIYSIDLNVFFDYLKNRNNLKYVANIVAMSMSGHVRLFVTKEFTEELRRNSVGEDPVLRFAEQIKCLPMIEKKGYKELHDDIYSLIFPEKLERTKINDNSDVNHIVASIVNEIDGFITSEKKILRQSEQIFRKYRLQILSPYEMYLGDDILDSHPITVDNDDIEIAHSKTSLTINSNPLSDIIPPRAIAEINSSDYDNLYRIIAGQTVVGIMGLKRVKQNICQLKTLLVLDETSTNIYQIIDKCLDFIHEHSAGNEYCQVIVKVKKDSEVLIQNLNEQLFLRNNIESDFFTEFVRLHIDKQIFKKDWTHFNEILEHTMDFKGPLLFPSYDEMLNSRIAFSTSKLKKYGMNLFDFETFFYPAILMCLRRPGVIIPIHNNFISAFFPKQDIQDDLFPNHSASVACEKVYYKAPKKSKDLEKGKLAFFYESSYKGGAKQIIGYGRITSSQIVDVDTLSDKFYRQGVLPDRTIRKIAKNGKIHVVTFSNFRVFENPVDYSVLEKEEIISGARLVTAQGIDYKVVNKIMKFGNNGA